MHTHYPFTDNSRGYAAHPDAAILLLILGTTTRVYDRATFQQQSETLAAELEAARIDVAASASEDVDVRAALEFASQALVSAAELGRELPLDQRQRFQRVLTPDGITVNADGVVGTPITSPVFNVLEGPPATQSSLALWRGRDIDLRRATFTIGQTKNHESRTVPLFPMLAVFLQ